MPPVDHQPNRSQLVEEAVNRAMETFRQVREEKYGHAQRTEAAPQPRSRMTTMALQPSGRFVVVLGGSEIFTAGR